MRVLPVDLSSLESLRRRYADLRHEPGKITADLCRSAFHFRALDGRSHLGFSSLRDYLREGLGVKASEFHRWARVGELLTRHPLYHADLVAGRLGLSVLDELALGVKDPDAQIALRSLVVGRSVARVRELVAAWQRRNREEGDDTTSEKAAGDSTEEASRRAGDHESGQAADHAQADPSWVRLRFRLPVAADHYLRDTLLLASARAGRDLPDHLALDCVLMEAAEHVPPLVESVEDAERALPHLVQGKRLPKHSHKPAKRARVGSYLPASLVADSACSPARRRRKAVTLHRWMVRLLEQRACLQRRQEDALLELLREGVHARAGHHLFWTFCEEVLDLSESTARRRIHRAEMRRREHPLYRALDQGRLTEVQAAVLETLARRAAVPRSCLARWVDYAASTTVRRLRDAVAWARGRHLRDHLAWTRQDCPPPTDDELATSKPSLVQLARNPDPVALEKWSQGPWCSDALLLDGETAAVLLLYLACLHRRGQQLNRGPFPDWLVLTQLLHLARQAWDTPEEVPLPRRQRDLFDRYGWRCMVPGCTRRAQLHAHHLVYVSRGGGDEAENLLPLCAFHHLQGEHGGLLEITGRADPTGRRLTVRLGRRPDGRYLWTYRGEVLIEKSG